MKANSWVEDVRKFWNKNLPYRTLVSRPHLPSGEEIAGEMASLAQEMAELFEAMAKGDLEKVADGAVDSIYVLIGICLNHGFDPTPIWNEVQRSNMDKVPAAPGTLGRRTSEGQSCKPKGWVPPKIKEALEKQGWKH